MRRKGNPRVPLLVRIQTVVAAVETVWSFLKKLKVELPLDPVIPLLGIYLKKTKTIICKNIRNAVFIAVLFTKPSYGSNPSAHQ